MNQAQQYRPPREALRLAREEAKLTQEQAAKRAGYKRKSSWAMIELGYNTPPVQQMIRMAQVVGKRPSEVFEELREVDQVEHAHHG